MKIDLHSHTILSGHAYSTLKENIDAARIRGIEAFAVTDHGPAMPSSQQDAYHIVNMRLAVPEYIDGIRIIRGFESNIIDYDGKIDLPSEYTPYVEYIIGSLHEICIVPRSKKENTEGVINTMASGYVDAIGHPDGFGFPLDYPAITEAAKEYEVALELNNNTLKGRVRGDCRENYLEMLYYAKQNGVYISVGSDAHFYTGIGEMDLSTEMLKEVGYPEDLIISKDLDHFNNFMKIRRQERIIY